MRNGPLAVLYRSLQLKEKRGAIAEAGLGEGTVGQVKTCVGRQRAHESMVRDSREQAKPSVGAGKSNLPMQAVLFVGASEVRFLLAPSKTVGAPATGAQLHVCTQVVLVPRAPLFPSD